MKLRSCLVALIILAQLGWLGYHYHFRTEELRAAPRITVKPFLTSYGSIFCYKEDYNLTDSPLFGKSLWWDAEKWTINANFRHNDEEKDSSVKPFTGRPAPGDEVQGALELVPKQHHEGTELIAIWSKGEDGFWTFRLEAPGSSEATPHEGEFSTRAMLWSNGAIYTAPADHPESKSYSVSLVIHPFISPTREASSFSRYNPSINFYMNNDDRHVLRDWMRHATQKQLAQLPCALDIALRESSPPMAVQASMFGLPIHEAILRIKEGKITLPEAPKSDDSHPQKTEPAQPSNKAAEEILNLAEDID